MPQAADMFGLAFLTDGEREVILEVLRRDEGLRQAEEQRVEEVRRKLKEEMLDIKRKGAKRGSGRYSQRTCRRCQEALSRLTLTSRQCRACKHCVCRNCQTPQPPPAPRGSWLCCVCAKESNIKKCTLVQDWFYDQRVNRFVTTPGHDLASSSLKKRPPLKKRETMGELLLVELNPSQPAPVPRPRQKDQTMHKSDSPSEASGSVASRESYTEKEHVESKDPQQRSDTESAEKASLCSAKAETESGRVTPDLPREEKAVGRSSPAGSTASSPTTTIKPDRVSIHSADSLANTDSEAKQVSSSFEESGMEIHRLFKKSIRHGPKPPEHTSALGSMGNRSHSVPFLDLQEEDEDIDNLVNKFHRKTVNSSTSSLASSKVDQVQNRRTGQVYKIAPDVLTTSSSMTSIYSENGDYDSVECVTGDLTFSLSYDEHTQSFNVYIKECHRLAYGDSSRKLSNPYVKCYLLPEKTRQSKRKTNTKRHTVNPIFKETLKYAISRSQLQTRSILLSVWHHSRITRNAFLGEVEVALDCHDLDSPQEQCVPLMAKGVPAQASIFAPYRGELVISLKYITPKKPTDDKSKGKKAKAEGGGGELHVWIKEAKSLTAMKTGGTSDSFVKGYLLPAKAKITKKKTPLVKKSLNPHYDHTFVYKELSLEQLRDMCLELTVWDREPLSTNDFLGGVRLSTGTGTLTTGKEEVEMDSVGEEIGLWQKMMQYPDSWAEGTLPLRSSMGKTQAK